MAQHLKTKNINIIPGHLFCARSRANFLLETEIHCTDDEDKVHSSTRTGNEFTECQTPRKKLQSVLISRVRLHAVMNTINRNISEAYKIQVDCLEDSESYSYNKNDLKEKKNDLVRLLEALQGKLKTASYSEEIQIIILVPAKWSRKYCSEYFNVFEYLL